MTRYQLLSVIFDGKRLTRRERDIANRVLDFVEARSGRIEGEIKGIKAMDKDLLIGAINNVSMGYFRTPLEVLSGKVRSRDVTELRWIVWAVYGELMGVGATDVQRAFPWRNRSTVQRDIAVFKDIIGMDASLKARYERFKKLTINEYERINRDGDKDTD